ncbi:unnamed protein product [Cunninghamella echinulata]
MTIHTVVVMLLQKILLMIFKMLLHVLEANIKSYIYIKKKNRPKQRNSAYPKTPTVLLYKENSQEVLAWGDAAKNLVERPNVKDHLLERFKLYLDEASASNLPELPNGLLSIQVIADYLNQLHNYICEHMKRGFAQNYDQHQFRYCLTIPAQWLDRSCQNYHERSGHSSRNY